MKKILLNFTSKSFLLLVSLMLTTTIAIAQPPVSVVAGSVTTSKLSYTAGAGSNRAIYAVITDQCANSGNCGGLNVSGVTWGGQAMTSVVVGTASSGIIIKHYILKESGIVAAGAGPHNFVVTWAGGTPTGELFTALTTDNVDQAGNFGAGAPAFLLTPTSTTIGPFSPTACLTNQLAIYTVVSQLDGDTHTPPTGYTQQALQNTGAVFTTAVSTKPITVNGNEQPISTFGTASSLLGVLSIVPWVAVPTPIQLTYFSADLVGHREVKLNWQTANETNNDYFVIERSKDGNEWQQIEQMDGAGNSNEILNYTFTDKEAHIGLSYYRLKQIDFDKNGSFSNVQSIRTAVDLQDVIVSPNPAKDKLLIQAGEQELQILKVYDITGRDVTLNCVITKKRNDLLQLNTTALPEGIYFLKTRSSVKKLLINK